MMQNLTLDAHAHGFWVGTGAILFSWCNSIRHGWAWVRCYCSWVSMGKQSILKGLVNWSLNELSFNVEIVVVSNFDAHTVVP